MILGSGSHPTDTSGPKRSRRERRAGPRMREALVCAARIAVLVLIALCGHIISSRAMRPIIAYAASGEDRMMVTYLVDNAYFSRHMLNAIEAYCLDSKSPPPRVGTYVNSWTSGSLALDYVLYHSLGCTDDEYQWYVAKYACWAIEDPLCNNSPSRIQTTINTSYADSDLVRELYDAAQEFAQSGGLGPERGTSRIYEPAIEGDQRLAIGRTGIIKLEKSSTDPDVTSESDAYSLAGATYAIYRDEECTQEVIGARMVTDAAGCATSVPLGAAAPTTYYVKELIPSPGFALDDEVHPALVSVSTPVTVTSQETPSLGNIRIAKRSRGTVDIQANANYSLAGAVYGIYSGSECTEDDLVTTVTTDEEGHALTKDLSEGTYWVKEIEPSAGHELDPVAHQVDITRLQTSEVASDEQQLYGQVDITKTSAAPDLTANNGSYDLDGARYGIYASEDCLDSTLVEVLTLRRSTDGTCAYAKSGDLGAGDYWVRELADGAPAGYLGDPHAYPVTVSLGGVSHVSSEGAESVTDLPAHAPVSVLVAKVDAEGALLDEAGGQGAASLGGARFEVRHYDGLYESAASLPARPSRTWILTTNAQGEARLDEAEGRDGDEVYTLGDGQAPVLPLGTYAFREISAPPGYWLEGQTADSPADYVAPTHLSQVVRDESAPTGAVVRDLDWDRSLAVAHAASGNRVVGDLVKRAGISIVKVDRQTLRPAPQAGASLAGISFAIINRNDQAVLVDGTLFGPDEEIVPARLVTDENGRAATEPDDLPIGSYEVTEIAANDSYRTDAASQVVTLTASDAGRIRALDASFSDEVVRGGVKVAKIDRESGSRTPQGAGSFEGIVMGVRLAAFDSAGNPQHSAIVEGAEVQAGEIATTIVLDHEGLGQTAPDALPYGSWELVELSVPRDSGYKLNDSWSASFDVHTEGTIVDLAGPGSCVANEVMRGDLKGEKADASSHERLARIPFVLESLTTGEWHVLLTDLKGRLDTSSDHAPRQDGKANANDAAVTRTEDGYLLSDPSCLDEGAGIWFCGGTGQGAATTPDDSRGALPYDSYRLVELRVSASDAALTGGATNDVHELVELAIEVREDGATLDLGTIYDRPQPEVGTILAHVDDRSHVGSAPAQEDVTLIDVVRCHNLVRGESYQLEGELHLLGPDGSDAGILATGSCAFTAEAPMGSEEIGFTLDAQELAGCSVVAFERLLCDGKVVAAHEDLANTDQTVDFVGIGTTLTDEAGSHETLATATVRLTDTVSYTGLRPEGTYEVVGTLVDRETGDPIMVGTHPLSARTSFVAEASSGTVEVVFEVDGALVAGKDVVAFERLEHQGRELAIHADIDDEGQTVSFPRIGTTLSDASSTEHVAPAGPVELVDVVSYENLVVGQSYVVIGALMDRETGEPMRDPSTGEAIVERMELIPSSASGEATISFSFDATDLAGHSVVAFEEVWHEGRRLAVHADLSDEGQTVSFPAIATTLSDDTASGRDEGPAEEEVTLVDTVAFSGLVPGKEYELTGTLHDRQSGEVMADPDGSPLQSRTVFTPKEPSGSVDVTFTFDARPWAGRTLVAFERLEQAGRTYAVHADLEDEGQSYRFPSIHTTLTDQDGASELAAKEKVTLVDTVAYENLRAGRSYTLTGTLMDVRSGMPLAGARQATTEFVPNQASGTTTVSFELDARALAGCSLVAFEELGFEGHVVATHADLADEGQTVVFQKPPEEPKVPPEEPDIPPEEPDVPPEEPDVPPEEPVAPPEEPDAPREETPQVPTKEPETPHNETPRPVTPRSPLTSDIVIPWFVLLAIGAAMIAIGLPLRLHLPTRRQHDGKDTTGTE